MEKQDQEWQLLDFISEVIRRFKDIKRDGYTWIDAIADELQYFGYEVRQTDDLNVKGG